LTEGEKPRTKVRLNGEIELRDEEPEKNFREKEVPAVYTFWENTRRDYQPPIGY
jgi:hypothetical protein